MDLPRRKAAALLLYLAVSGERQPRETLATFLWPNSDQKRAYAYLRNAIWEINRTLGEGWLLADRERVGLDPGADIALDLREFRDLLALGERQVHPDEEANLACVEALESAAQLYRGDFTAGFGLPDSPAFDEWQFFQAEETRQSLMDGLVRLVQILVSNDRLEEALAYARRWSNLDPINEAAHRQLMRLYAWNGQRNAAIRQYRECQDILKQELNIEPEAATTELFQRIQRGEMQRTQALALSPEMFSRQAPLSVPEAAMPDPETSAPLDNLPIPPTPFVGRQAELAQIAAQIANPDDRLITLLGPGGIGKTRLAIRAAREGGGRFQHGVCFVSLASLRSGQPILPGIIDALGLHISGGDKNAAEQLIDFLRPRQLLLVLDNFEHHLPQAPLLSEILGQAPAVKIMATSRMRLNLQPERVTEISGLRFPDPQEVGSIRGENGFVEKYCAAELFLHAAQRARSDFTITPTDYAAVARITQLVAGMPLGLELAASWVNVLTPAEIAAEIEQGLDFLESSMQDVPARQRSMRAVFDYSWKLMSRREQAIFPKLSVFRGGFTREAAKKVLGVTPSDLMGLVGKSLIQRAVAGRFDLHPLLRQYATDILEGLAVRQAVHEAHCDYYTAALRDLGESMIDRRQQQALSVLDADLDNAWAAWEWAVEHRQVARIDQALVGLFSFLERGFRFEEGVGALRAAEGALASPQDPDERRVYGHLLAWRALLEIRLGNLAGSQPTFRRSWEQIEQAAAAGVETRFEKAFLYRMKAYMSIENGDLEVARDLLEQALAFYKEIDHKHGASEALFNLGWLLAQQGDMEVVGQYQQGSLELKRQIGDYFGIANDLYFMAAQEAFHHGNIEQAKEIYWESSDIFQDLGDPISRARSLRIMDDLYILEGWFEVALVTRQKMMQQYQKLGDPAGIGLQHTQLGEAYYHLGDYDNAETQSRQALITLQDRDYPFEQAFARWQLGMTLLAREQAEEAAQLFQDCLQAYSEYRRQDGVGSAHAGLALAAYKLGAYAQAWEHCLKALRRLSEYQHIFWMFYALGTMALLLAQQAQVTQAIEIYSLIRRYNFVANSRWFQDVIGRHLDQTAANALPATEVAAARKRGEAMQVWATVNQLLENTRLPV
jgi:predicted ATPase/DNA-binding SARP family transcriptional activator